MSERWRDHYDHWKFSSVLPQIVEVLDEDGEPIDQDELDAQAEAAAEARAERQREDEMFDGDWEERYERRYYG